MANQGKRMVSEDQIKKLENLADIREAGDGITIEDGVISAGSSGAEYTAGTGIEITDENVINNTAPGKTFYEHYISYYRDSSGDIAKVNAVVLNDSSTPFTKSGFIKWLYDNGFVNGAKMYPSSNVYQTNSLKYVGSGIYIEQDPGTTGNSVFGNRGLWYTNNTLTIDGPLIDLSLSTFTDTVFEK